MENDLPKFHDYKGQSVQPDWVDLRDQNYTPNLSVLRNECYINESLLIDVNGRKHLRFGLRNQGMSGRCAGYALANMIDIQRALQFERRRKNNGLSAEEQEQQRQAHYNNIVSADMLYRMAYFHDRYPDRDELDTGRPEGVRTLRSAVKGFYHHGVCYDWTGPVAVCPPSCWQSESYLDTTDLTAPGFKRPLFPQVEQAKAARNIGLGAYYRLASILNHFHAALNDAEAILVSARVHAGWDKVWNGENAGIIPFDPQSGMTGTHAFVIVGYDSEGFHILNSAGPSWGGYKGQAGIGLLTYEDWAQNIVDAWVLRLGVHAPKAFGASVGEKGVKGQFSIQKGSTPCFELVGHYIHLDDGFHVRTGAYPSFKDGWEKTRGYLRENLKGESNDKPYKGILVWIPGSLEDIKSAFGAAVKRKNRIKALGLYPYSIFWCNSFAEKSMEVLTGLFDTCKEQAGADAPHLDDLIESRVRGVGRAFWRDIELSARRSVIGPTELPYEKDQDEANYFTPGFVTIFLKDLFQFVEETGAELHLVVEGAGVLVLHEILDAIRSDARKPKEKRQFCAHQTEKLFTSVHMVSPAIGLYRAGKKIIPFVEKMNTGLKSVGTHEETDKAVLPLSRLNRTAPAQIYVPSPELDSRLSFGAYSRSILHLVANAFEDRYALSNASDDAERPPVGPARTFLGMSKIIDPAFISTRENKGAAERITRRARLGITQIHRTQNENNTLGRVQQRVFDKDPGVHDAIFDSILALRDAEAAAKKGD